MILPKRWLEDKFSSNMWEDSLSVGDLQSLRGRAVRVGGV